MINVHYDPEYTALVNDRIYEAILQERAVNAYIKYFELTELTGEAKAAKVEGIEAMKEKILQIEQEWLEESILLKD